MNSTGTDPRHRRILWRKEELLIVKNTVANTSGEDFEVFEPFVSSQLYQDYSAGLSSSVGRARRNDEDNTATTESSRKMKITEVAEGSCSRTSIRRIKRCTRSLDQTQIPSTSRAPLYIFLNFVTFLLLLLFGIYCLFFECSGSGTARPCRRLKATRWRFYFFL